MRSFQVVNGYFSSVKNKVTSAIQSMWKNESIQEAYQGLTAPMHSSHSLKKLVSSSKDIQTCLSRAFTENSTFAMRAIVPYFVYHRVIHPILQENLSVGSSDEFKGVINYIDLVLYVTMICYLISHSFQNSAQNLFINHALTDSAATAMKPENEQRETMGVDSVIYYLANRYIVNPVSWKMTHNMPGLYGKTLAFGLETLSIGLPLVEYKFSAMGHGAFHKYADMLMNYKIHCVMYGASFVAATWSSYKILERIAGDENPFLFDAVFSMMFQMYTLLAIVHEKKLPEKAQSMRALDEKNIPALNNRRI